MPFLHLSTNLAPDDSACGQLARELSGEVARLLGKPERYVMLRLSTGERMLFAGDDAPTAYLELKNVGLDPAQTAPLAAALCDLLESRLGIPASRTYIEFTDIHGPAWGWNRSTF
jgi:phenylpyruvate tautomerase PptA (4-oxalocrotonate tautomerase family)